MLDTLRPTMHVRCFDQLPVRWLVGNGFLALSLDLDKTIVGQHDVELSSSVQ